jgi:tetratricopeptide (TPR) repeat protein
VNSPRAHPIPLIVLVMLAGAAALTPVADSDIWWHMAAGREMIARRGFLWADPFSLGARGRPWIDLHWLFQLGAYGLFRLGGLAALVAGKVVFVGAGAWLWWRTVQVGIAPRSSDPAGADAAVPRHPAHIGGAMLAVALPLGLFFVRHLLLVRPVILTLVFLAAFVLLLERFAATGRARVLWWLPALTAVWANCQGLWPLGSLAVGCVLAGDLIARIWRRRELPEGGARRLAGVLAACLLAGLITPYGWRGLVLPVKLLLRLVPANANVFSNQVAENVPPWVLARSEPLSLLPLLVLVLLTAASFTHAPAHRRFGRGLLVLAFLGLALSANRNVLLCFWIAIPVAVVNAAPAVAQAIARWPRAPVITWWAGAAGVAGLMLLAFSRETPLHEPTPFRVPAGSARIIDQDPGQGRIFGADHYGGYLIWTLHPRAAPYLDTRLVLRTADEYAEFLALLEQPQGWDGFARKHAFDHAVLPTDYPDRYLPLAAQLYRSADWRLVYTDGTESLFRHAAAGTPALDLGSRAATERILAEQARRYRRPEVAAAARRQLARLQLALRHPEECLHVLSVLLLDDAGAQSLAGRCHLELGDLTAAEAMARRLLEQDDDSVPGFNLLALVSLARGDLSGGIGWLRKALSADPYDPEARAILDQLEAQAGQPPKSP